MNERGIIIADKDAEFLCFAADFFEKAGYRVQTTDTAGEALNDILGKETSILLLGSGFVKSVSSANLIHLLKSFNRHLQIILVSDEMTLSQSRQVRQEGIFYHAMKPATADDMNELGEAVACAFKLYPSSVLCDKVAAEKDDQPALLAAAEIPGSGRVPHWKALSWTLGAAALAFGASYFSPSVANPGRNGASLIIGIFLGFCAMIVVGQLLPIFRVKLAAKWHKARQAVRDGK